MIVLCRVGALVACMVATVSCASADASRNKSRLEEAGVVAENCDLAKERDNRLAIDYWCGKPESRSKP